jgi:putative ABC transport system ATP-binding protein
MILRVDGISKRYARPSGDRIALDGVSLELRRGEIIGIFGASGSGKTTLLRIAAGLEAPDSGVVTYNGERLDQMSAAQQRRFRRREVGCVWAGEPWLPGLSVLEHVALPLLVDGYDHRTAERLARKFMLACEADQCIAADPQELSDGERQRAAIARALVIEPRLLLVDGAVSNLSLVEQDTIMALLALLARDARLAVLVTDTGAGSVLLADPILYLRDGRLATVETPGELGKLYQLPSAAGRRFAADA